MNETKEAELTHFLCIGNNAWGKAKTKQGARLQWSKSGGKGDPSYYRVPEDYWVDDFGSGHGSAKAVLISGEDVRN